MSEAGRALPVLAGALTLLLAQPFAVRAQVGELERRCTDRSGATALCARLADVVEIVSARAALAAAGGSPVIGTASTIGHRLPGQPRLGFAGRFHVVPVEIPDFAAIAGTGHSDFMATAWTADVVLGLFNGFSPAPTLGGVASIDLFAGGGVVHLPIEKGFRSRTPGTWTVGARVGILRESFTAPGVSISGQYRRLSAWNAGDVRLSVSDAFARAGDASIWSARATAGKRVGLVALTVGAGWDRTETDVVLRLPGAAEPIETRFDSYTSERRNLFASAAWTWLVFTFAAEVGWQSGAPDRTGDRPGGGGAWGGLGARLTF